MLSNGKGELMRLQQWGTFSVRDHLKPRAFVAEVLLFDKLVIPRPATQKEMNAEGRGEPSEDQVIRWRRNQWDPDHQRDLLDILGEEGLAIELPWGRQAERDWRGVYNPDPENLECGRSELAQSVREQVEQAKVQMPEEAAYHWNGRNIGSIRRKRDAKRGRTQALQSRQNGGRTS